jgi:hypothetical protein
MIENDYETSFFYGHSSLVTFSDGIIVSWGVCTWSGDVSLTGWYNWYGDLDSQPPQDNKTYSSIFQS